MLGNINLSGGEERTAADVHATLCALVTSNAASHAAWADYAAVLLDPETEAFFRARLPVPGAGGEAGGGGGGGDKASNPKKKRKLAVEAGSASVADVTHCVRCPDGVKFSVTVPADAQVGELRRAIGRQRGIPYFAIDLFLGGGEERLADGDRLNAATDTAVPSLFMLLKVVSDRLALAAIFQNTHGEGWIDKDGGWEDLEKEDPDGGLAALYGVKAVDEEGRVTELLLDENNLVGSITGEILQLSALQFLNLEGNQLTGPIPAELGQLGALTGLYLHNNQLTGPIPAELGQLGALVYLGLVGNQLTGTAAFHAHVAEHNPGCVVHV